MNDRQLSDQMPEQCNCPPNQCFARGRSPGNCAAMDHRRRSEPATQPSAVPAEDVAQTAEARGEPAQAQLTNKELTAEARKVLHWWGDTEGHTWTADQHECGSYNIPESTVHDLMRAAIALHQARGGTKP